MGFTENELNQEKLQQFKQQAELRRRADLGNMSHRIAYFGEESATGNFLKGHKTHQFAMERMSAVSVCTLHMLNKGYSLEEVLELKEPKTEEEIARRTAMREEKREAGEAFLRLLDHPSVEIPEGATQAERESIEREFVAKKMGEEFVGAYPKIYQAMDNFVKKHPLNDVAAYGTTEGAVFLGVGYMMADLAQEFCRNDEAKRGLRTAMAQYSGSKTENDPPLDERIYENIGEFGGLIQQFGDYFSGVEKVIDKKELSAGDIRRMVGKAPCFNAAEALRQKKQKEDPNAPVQENFTHEDCQNAIFAGAIGADVISADTAVQVRNEIGEKQIVEDLMSGHFVKQCHAELIGEAEGKANLYGAEADRRHTDLNGIHRAEDDAHIKWYKAFEKEMKERYDVDLNDPAQLGRFHMVDKKDTGSLNPMNNTYESKMVYADLDRKTNEYRKPLPNFENGEKSMKQVIDWHKENVKPINPDDLKDGARILRMYQLAKEGKLFFENFGPDDKEANLSPEHALQIQAGANGSVHVYENNEKELEPYYVGNQKGKEYEHLSKLLAAEGVEPVAEPKLKKQNGPFSEKEKKAIADYREYQLKIREMKLKEDGYEVTPELLARIDASKDHRDMVMKDGQLSAAGKQKDIKKFVNEYHSRPAHHEYKNHKLTRDMTIEERTKAVKKLQKALGPVYTDAMAGRAMLNEEKWTLHDQAKNAMMVETAQKNNLARLNIQVPKKDPLARAAVSFLDPENSPEADERNKTFMDALKNPDGRLQFYDKLVDLVRNAKKEDFTFENDEQAAAKFEKARNVITAIELLPKVTAELKASDTEKEFVTPAKEQFAHLCQGLKPFADRLKGQVRYMANDAYAAIPMDLPEAQLKKLVRDTKEPDNDRVFDELAVIHGGAEAKAQPELPVTVYMNSPKNEPTTESVLKNYYSEKLQPDMQVSNTSAMRYFTDAMIMTPAYGKLAQIAPAKLSERIAANDQKTMQLLDECMEQTKKQVTKMPNFAAEQNQIFLHHEVPELPVPKAAEPKAEKVLPAAKEKVNTEEDVLYAEKQRELFNRYMQGKENVEYPMKEVLHHFMNAAGTPEAEQENLTFLKNLETPEGKRSFAAYLMDELTRMNPIKLIAETDEKALAAYREYGPMIHVAAHMDDLKDLKGFVMSPGAEEKLEKLKFVKEASQNVVTRVESLANEFGRSHSDGITGEEAADLKYKKQLVMQESDEINLAASDAKLIRAMKQPSFDTCLEALEKREQAVISSKNMATKLQQKDKDLMQAIVDAGMQQAELRGTKENLYVDPKLIRQEDIDKSLKYLQDSMKKEQKDLKKIGSMFSKDSQEYKDLEESLKNVIEATGKLMEKPYKGTHEQKVKDIDALYKGISELEKNAFAYDGKKSIIDEKDRSTRQKDRMKHTAVIERICQAAKGAMDRGIAQRTKPLTEEEDVFRKGKNIPNFRKEQKAEKKAEKQAENQKAVKKEEKLIKK